MLSRAQEEQEERERAWVPDAVLWVNVESQRVLWALGQYIGALVELCRAANGAQGASSGRRASSDQQCWWARKASATLAAA